MTMEWDLLLDWGKKLVIGGVLGGLATWVWATSGFTIWTKFSSFRPVPGMSDSRRRLP